MRVVIALLLLCVFSAADAKSCRCKGFDEDELSLKQDEEESAVCSTRPKCQLIREIIDKSLEGTGLEVVSEADGGGLTNRSESTRQVDLDDKQDYFRDSTRRDRVPSGYASSWKSRVSSNDDTLKESLSQTKNDVLYGVGKIEDGASREYTTVKDTVSKDYYSMRNKVARRLSSAKSKLSQEYGDIKDNLSKDYDDYTDDLSKGYASVKRKVSQSFDDARDAVSKEYSTVKDDMSKGYSEIKDGAESLGDQIASKVKALKDFFTVPSAASNSRGASSSRISNKSTLQSGPLSCARLAAADRVAENFYKCPPPQRSTLDRSSTKSIGLSSNVKDQSKCRGSAASQEPHVRMRKAGGAEKKEMDMFSLNEQLSSTLAMS